MLQEHDVISDTRWTDWDNELNNDRILKRHNEMYMRFCANRGESFKYQEEEYYNKLCSGAEHRVQKLKHQ